MKLYMRLLLLMTACGFFGFAIAESLCNKYHCSEKTSEKRVGELGEINATYYE